MPRAKDFIQNLPTFFRQHIRLIGEIAVGFFVILLAIQISYPRDRLLPGVTIQGEPVGMKTVQQATDELDRIYQKAQLSLHIAGRAENIRLNEAGIDVAAHSAAQTAARYSFWQRLVPFSMFMQRDQELATTYDDERLQYFVEQLAESSSRPAVNAGVKVEGSQVVLVPSRPALEYPVADITKSIRATKLSRHMDVHLKPITSPPQRNDEAVLAAVAKAQHVVDTPMKLQTGDRTTVVDKSIVASWLDFPEDPATKQLTMAVKTDAVQAYLSTLQPKAYRAPGVTKVVLVDGREVSRESGAAGIGIDAQSATNQIAKAIMNGESLNLSLTMAVIPAKVTYDRQYSDTQAGLSAFLNDVSSGMSVAVYELAGRGRSANANGGKRITAASTYKLFVAYAVIKQVEAGAMTWTDQVVNGHDVASCFEVMIVRSDNPCGKALGDRIGWGNIEGMMRSIGLGSTSLSGEFTTTANDLAFFLRQLQNGSLLSANGSGRLLDAMHRQIYRAGVPAGTKADVANKVGFIGNLLHDAAIVYGPNGPYVLVFMTSGSSWSEIARVSGQIHAFLNR